MILKCMQYITKEYMLLLKSISTWLQYQKNIYIDKLDDIVNEYNNTYQRNIKMKPVDVKDNISWL